MLDLIAFTILLLPLFAAAVGGGLGPVFGDKFTMRLTSGSTIFAALLSVYTYVQIAVLGHAPIQAELFEWINTPAFSVSFGVLVDKLTATMLVVVTIVSACVHVYSVGYMHEDQSKSRFFAYLSLFTFMMLALVTAPNMLQMFLGWEGVGLASYLLIGFWYYKESANAASIKAFIVNRVADVGLLLALFTTFAAVGSLEYYDLFSMVPQLAEKTYHILGYDVPVLTLIAFFAFIGAMGKSAQFGFHVWLPDAMEGPTPVSALIHAATMVTAGVFLVCRLSPVFEMAPGVLLLVAWVGGFTALFAATVGLTQRDIKRVIAYSTCSQLGYMFFACGVSAYGAAMFHLTTHAFFKALLFLGAGAVIHALHHQQDMFKMGGVRKYLVVTYALMWVGSLALAGIPPFAGFFSKDLILESAFMNGSSTGYWLYALGTVAALMTAFYSFRVIFLTFHGQSKLDDDHLKHVHDSPDSMLIPMLVLVVGAIFGGLVFHSMAAVEWWQGAIHVLPQNMVDVHHISLIAKFTPLVFSLLGIWAAWQVYIRRQGLATKIAQQLSPLYAVSFNKWYIDELYNWAIVKNIKHAANSLWQLGDVKGIDAIGPMGAAWLAGKSALRLRATQTGYIFHYAFALIVGVCVLITWLILTK